MGRFRLIMISAMYENGGNTIHRMLDGHPELFVYPFESQVGTGFNDDYLSSTVPLRYRWPEFPMSGTPEQDYEMIWDEELKTRMRVPERSKFRDVDIEMDEAERKKSFVRMLRDKPRTRANIVEAYFRSTFEAWKNHRRSGREKAYVGYNPVQCLDAEKIFEDFPDAHVLHVVRNPYSGFADTRKRPFPLPMSRYVWTWNYCQLVARTWAERHPAGFHIVRLEDLLADPRATMSEVCRKLEISFSETCLYPSFNGRKLEEVFPWGTIRVATPEANLAAANELTPDEKQEVRSLGHIMMREFGYEDFL